MQNDELMEYAFPRSNEFHFATVSIASKTGVNRPHFGKASGLLRSVLRRHPRFAETDEGRRKELNGFLVLD